MAKPTTLVWHSDPGTPLAGRVNRGEWRRDGQGGFRLRGQWGSQLQGGALQWNHCK